jgi:hypothetical protein
MISNFPWVPSRIALAALPRDLKSVRAVAGYASVLALLGSADSASAQPAQPVEPRASTATAPSNEGFDMERLMNQTTEAGKASDVVFKDKGGAWVLARGKDPATARTCSVIYFDRQNGTSLSYRGPRPGVGDRGSLVFIGPDIPNTPTPAEVRVTLETEGERPQTIPAGLLPKQGDAPPAVLVSTDIRATIAVIQPTERVRLSLGNRVIYALNWSGGGHEAKRALLSCLGGS